MTPDDLHTMTMEDYAEVDRLRRWKAEATEVILGLQDVGKALGLGLGERITGASATEAAKRLHARAEAAEAQVARVEAVMPCAAAHCHCGGDRGSVPTSEIRAALDGPTD
jgi:hypothetical protein